MGGTVSSYRQTINGAHNNPITTDDDLKIGDPLTICNTQKNEKEIKSTSKKAKKRKYEEMRDETETEMEIMPVNSNSAPKPRKQKFDAKVEQLEKLKAKLSKLHKMGHVIKNLATSHCKNKLFLQKNEINFNLSEIKEFAPIIKQHSDLPPIQEISECLSFYALTFKSMPGSETLWDYIKKKDNLTEWDIRDFMSQLLLAVLFLHRHNFVHLDISPETLMVCNDKIVLYGFETMKLINDYKTYEIANLFYGKSDEKIFNYFWALSSCANTYNRKCLNGMQLKALDIFQIGMLTHFLLTATFPSIATNNKQQYPTISTSANDFIYKLLQNEVNVHEAINHKWIKINGMDVDNNVLYLDAMYEKYHQQHQKEVLLKYDVLTQQIHAYLFVVDHIELNQQIQGIMSQLGENDKKNTKIKLKKKRKKREEMYSAEMRKKFNADIDWFIDPKDGKKWYYWKSKNNGKWETKGVAYQHISRNWNSNGKEKRKSHIELGHCVEEGDGYRCQFKKCTKKCKNKKQYNNHWRSHSKKDKKAKAATKGKKKGNSNAVSSSSQTSSMQPPTTSPPIKAIIESVPPSPLYSCPRQDCKARYIGKHVLNAHLESHRQKDEFNAKFLPPSYTSHPNLPPDLSHIAYRAGGVALRNPNIIHPANNAAHMPNSYVAGDAPNIQVQVGSGINVIGSNNDNFAIGGIGRGGGGSRGGIGRGRGGAGRGRGRGGGRGRNTNANHTNFSNVFNIHSFERHLHNSSLNYAGNSLNL